MLKLSTTIVIVVLASILLLVLIAICRETFSLTWGEISKLIFQFLLMVVVGGGVGFLFKKISDDRAENEKRSDRMRQMHSELFAAYSSAKRCRRQLRAYSSNGQISETKFIEQMDDLMQAQLVFELYEKRAKNNMFFSDGSAVRPQLKKIHEYLRTILGEYESKFASLRDSKGRIPLSRMPIVGEFIGPFDKKNRFNTDFKVPFYETLEIVSN